MTQSNVTRKQQKIIDRSYKDSLNPDVISTGNYQILPGGKKVEMVDMRRSF